jgi:hypothetical protein
MKSFILFQSSYIFESEPKSSIQVDNGDVIDINLTIISVKSLIPKDKDGYVDIIAEKYWQLAYSGNDTIKCITDGTFIGQYRIKRDSLMLIKTTKNKRSCKTKEKLVYPSIDNDGYSQYILTSDYDSEKKKYNISAHTLFGMIFNDNDDIFRNNNCDHIDRNRWCNKPENTRWVTSRENQGNKGQCPDKIDRQHDKKDIEYLEDWIAHVKSISAKREKIVTIKNEKMKYLDLLNASLQSINNEIREYNNIIDAGQKLRKFFGLKRMQEDKMIKSKYLSNLMVNADDFD